MKKVLIVMVLTLLISVPMLANAGQMNTGCGLGAIALGEQEGLVQQIVITFFNGLSYNQTFGITSGTSECTQHTTFVENERLNEYVAKNMDQLAQDIASGNGEALDTVAEIMEVPVENRSEFYAALQENFSNIYTSDDVQAADVIDNIVKVTS